MLRRVEVARWDGRLFQLPRPSTRRWRHGPSSGGRSGRKISRRWTTVFRRPSCTPPRAPTRPARIPTRWLSWQFWSSSRRRSGLCRPRWPGFPKKGVEYDHASVEPPAVGQPQAPAVSLSRARLSTGRIRSGSPGGVTLRAGFFVAPFYSSHEDLGRRSRRGARDGGRDLLVGRPARPARGLRPPHPAQPDAPHLFSSPQWGEVG